LGWSQGQPAEDSKVVAKGKSPARHTDDVQKYLKPTSLDVARGSIYICVVVLIVKTKAFSSFSYVLLPKTPKPRIFSFKINFEQK